MPSKRTLIKLARDGALAAASAGLLYVADHAADIGFSPEAAALLVPFALFAYRWVRAKAGKEPA